MIQKPANFFQKRWKLDAFDSQGQIQNQRNQLIDAFNFSSGVFMIDTRGYIKYINQNFCKFLGYRQYELQGKKYKMLLDQSEEGNLYPGMFHMLKEGQVWKDEVAYLDKTGQVFWANLHVLPYRNAQGIVSQFMGIVQDITLQKLYEQQVYLQGKDKQKLHKHQEQLNKQINYYESKLRYFTHKHTFQIFEIDFQGKICHTSRQDMISWEGKSIFDWIEPAFHRRFKVCLDKAYTLGEAQIAELKASSARGEQKQYRYWMRPVLNERKRIDNLLLIAEDISDHRQNKLRQKITYRIAQLTGNRKTDRHTLFKSLHEEVKRLIQAEEMYIALYDRDKKWVDFPYFQGEELNSSVFQSRKAARGITEMVIQSHQSIWIGPKGSGADRFSDENLTDFGKAPPNCIGVPMLVDGQIIGMLAIGSPLAHSVYSPDDIRFMEFVAAQLGAMFEREQVQEDLEKREEYFRALTGYSHDFTIVVNPNFQIVYISPCFERISKSPAKSYYSRDILVLVSSNRRAEVLSLLQRCQQSNEVLSEEMQYCLNGEDAWLEIRMSNQLENPAIKGIIINVRDITQRKLTEETLKEKNERLSRFAYINSHHVRGPLTNILGLVSLLEQDYQGLDPNLIKLLRQTADELDQVTRKANDVLYKIGKA